MSKIPEIPENLVPFLNMANKGTVVNEYFTVLHRGKYYKVYLQISDTVPNANDKETVIQHDGKYYKLYMSPMKLSEEQKSKVPVFLESWIESIRLMNKRIMPKNAQAPLREEQAPLGEEQQNTLRRALNTDPSQSLSNAVTAAQKCNANATKTKISEIISTLPEQFKQGLMLKLNAANKVANQEERKTAMNALEKEVDIKKRITSPPSKGGKRRVLKSRKQRKQSHKHQ